MTEVKSNRNRYLIVKPGVLLNGKLDNAISKLEKFFERALLKAFVTSGVRGETDQLNIIKQYCKRKKIEDSFIENADVYTTTLWQGKEIYSWQLAWSKLLNAGVIINPPLSAEVLLDYINRHGINRKGTIINPSVHFYGKAFDIGGGANSVSDEKAVLVEAVSSKEIPEIKSFLVERENNCLHVDII